MENDLEIDKTHLRNWTPSHAPILSNF